VHSPLLAALLYWWRVSRRPVDARLKWRLAGPFSVLAFGVVMMSLWLERGPDDLPAGYRSGELAGVMAVYTMACSLALATRARWVEPLFGGLDRMYLWHKRLAVIGMLLLAPHAVITGQIPGRQDSSIGVALGSSRCSGCSSQWASPTACFSTTHRVLAAAVDRVRHHRQPRHRLLPVRGAVDAPAAAEGGLHRRRRDPARR